MSGAEAFAAGCAVEPDGTASCWLHDRFDLLRGKAGWQAEGSVVRLGWRQRGTTGSALVQREGPYGGAPPTEAEIASHRLTGHPGLAVFLLEIEQVRSLVHEGLRSHWRANFGARCGEVSFDRGLAGLGFDSRALEGLAGALAALAPFLSGLDPEAGPLVRERVVQVGRAGMDGERGGARVDLYPGLDRTFGTGAPLAAAWRWFPYLRSTSARLYARDPEAFAALASGGEGAVREALAADLAAVEGPRAAALAFRCATAMDAMGTKDAERFGHDVGPGPGGVDPAARAGHALSRVPASWQPVSTGDWTAFGLCFPAVRWATGFAEGDDAGRMLNAKGDWKGLGRRLAVAHGGKAGRTALDGAVTDVGDMAEAFRDQCLVPALALAGKASGIGSVGSAAREALFSGRSAARTLEMSRDWHGRNDAMLAALPDGGVASAWDPVLPDAELGGIALRVLADRASLRAEGATGRDRDGASGLSHCVGGYAGRCLDGSCRILSLRAGPAPDAPRLSTAEVAWRGGVAVTRQHRGLRNGEPGPEAHAALDAYLAGLASGALAASSPDLPRVDTGDAVTRRCGYDWRLPGNWERTHAAWGRYLPAHLRGITPAALAALVVARGTGPARWRDRPFGAPAPGVRA